jgi:predicted lipoprotein
VTAQGGWPRRAWLGVALAALAVLAGGRAAAQGAASAPAVNGTLVPLYRPTDLVTGLYAHWAPPRCDAFVATAQGLVQALDRRCAAGAAAGTLDDARARWIDTVVAWEALSAVPFGPLIERRSARQIDFTPTRPELIRRAIERAPVGAADMERIGTPARGLPALEWLLWNAPVEAASPACGYAREVAADVAREAVALQAAFRAAVQQGFDDDAADTAFAEFVNQWLGGLLRLRWQHIERPVREGGSGGRRAPQLPRRAAGATAASWAAQWQALRALALADDAPAPHPGEGVVPLETYLRGRGHPALAGRWRQRVEASDRAMRGLGAGSRDRLLAAARDLAQTQRLAESDIAPALRVGIGFSDSDGD